MVVTVELVRQRAGFSNSTPHTDDKKKQTKKNTETELHVAKLCLTITPTHF